MKLDGVGDQIERSLMLESWMVGETRFINVVGEEDDPWRTQVWSEVEVEDVNKSVNKRKVSTNRILLE